MKINRKVQGVNDIKIRKFKKKMKEVKEEVWKLEKKVQGT